MRRLLSRVFQRFPKGFTIVELLIVITIIMILAVMGAGAYSTGKRIAVIDLHAERLVSMLHSLRDKTKAATPPKCLGIVLQRSAAPRQVEMPYLNSREGCDKNSQTPKNMDWQNDVIVKSVSAGAAIDTALPLIFSPPHGNIIAVDGLINDNRNTTFTIVIEYKDRTRTIEINEASGSIEKK